MGSVPTELVVDPADPEALTAFRAEVLGWERIAGENGVVRLADPEGNEFCLLRRRVG